MSLHAILTAIYAEGDTRVRGIETEAYTNAQKLLVDAQEDAARIREQACARTLAPAGGKHARIIHRARLEALRVVGDVRESLVDTAMARACGRLENLRTDNVYPKVLRRLVEEALSELDHSLEDEEQAKIEADPRDRLLVESILHDLGLEMSVRYCLDCWGGVVARSADGRVTVTNTIEGRLARATPYLRRYLASLFENEPQKISSQPDQVPARI